MNGPFAMSVRPTLQRAALAALLSLAGFGEALAQGGLQVAGNRSNHGARSVRPAFSPWTVSVSLGRDRTVDAAAQRLGPGCVGMVTVEPDVIVRASSALPVLRLEVSAAEPVALLVNTADGRWRCVDAASPSLRLADAPAGQYDVWVARRAAGAPARATLRVSSAP